MMCELDKKKEEEGIFKLLNAFHLLISYSHYKFISLFS